MSKANTAKNVKCGNVNKQNTNVMQSVKSCVPQQSGTKGRNNKNNKSVTKRTTTNQSNNGTTTVEQQQQQIICRRSQPKASQIATSAKWPYVNK